MINIIIIIRLTSEVESILDLRHEDMFSKIMPEL